MRHIAAILFIALGLPLRTAVAQQPGSADEGVVIPLWRNLPPATSPSEDRIEDRGRNGAHQRLMFNVTHPDLTLFQAPKDHNTGVAIIVCPGGGFVDLVLDKEGYDICHWLNTQGITGIVLRYRLPKGEAVRGEVPLPIVDAAQAMRVVRSHVSEWGIDPHKVGIMGFSAGGRIVSGLGTHFESGNPTATDPLARQSTRPDFLASVYGGVSLRTPMSTEDGQMKFLGPNPTAAVIDAWSGELHVTPQTPPAFITQAKDDPKVPYRNAELFHEALQANHVPSELLLFEKGDHGFGMGTNRNETGTWPGKFIGWLKTQKFIAGN